MRLLTWTEESVTWVWKRKWLILVVASTTAFIAATPLIWPGSWGIGKDKLATTTIERVLIDNQGNQKTETQEIIINAPGKSLWDGLSLLGVPLVLALLGAWFQNSQQQQADNKTREEVLQVYIGRISVLLVDRNLMGIASREKIEPEQQELLDVALDVIRASTLSILRRFENDTERKSSVMRFLAEAEIVSKLRLNLEEANLKGANLKGINLKGANLKGANLKGANLKGTNLQQASLQQANLQGANLQQASLQQANLQGANLNWSRLYRGNLKEANLQQVNLKRGNLKEANLQQVNLQQASFYATNLNWSRLEGANLQGANLEGANLYGTSLEGANLYEANLQRANLTKASLQGVILYKANLKEVRLKKASLEGVFLQKASLQGAIFYKANLQGASLEEANLNWTNLQGANLKGASLQGAIFSNISFNDETVWPDKDEVAKANNIPNELKRQIGLLPDSHPKHSPTQQNQAHTQ